MNSNKSVAFFSGFPDRRFTDEIARRLEKDLPERRCIVLDVRPCGTAESFEAD